MQEKFSIYYKKILKVHFLYYFRCVFVHIQNRVQSYKNYLEYANCLDKKLASIAARQPSVLFIVVIIVQ